MHEKNIFGFNKDEWSVIKSLNTPEKIQSYLDSLPYNHDTRPHTCFSPRLVLRHGCAHCMEGALLAAAALRAAGHPPSCSI